MEQRKAAAMPQSCSANLMECGGGSYSVSNERCRGEDGLRSTKKHLAGRASSTGVELEKAENGDGMEAGPP